MKNINKILAVSLIAMLAVPAAHAKIVAETMLSEQAGHYSGSHTVQSEINAKQDTLVVSGANKNIEGTNGITVTNEEGVITITGNSSDVSGLAERVTTAEGEIDDLQSGKLDKNTAITAGTHTKITYDADGLVTAGADLEASDIPSLTTQKTTALTGYSKAQQNEDLAATDSLNTALGKLEKKADDAATAAANASSTASSTYQIKSTADYQMGKAGGGWTTMSNAQKGALDSGITSAGVTQITTNKNAITTLNGDDTVTGSVKKTVKDAITALDLANTYDAKGSAAAAQTAAASDATTKADAAEAAAKAYADGLASNYAAASHNHASQDVNAMTGYSKAQTASAIAASDTLNQAIGKLEKKVDDAGAAATTPASASTAGVAKLYTETGQNTDGSMTQKAVTDALNTKLTKNTAITGATKTKITYDANGLVTAGADLAASDIPDIAESQVTGLVSDLAAKQTTANMVTDENAYNAAISDTTKYPNVAVVNKMIGDNNNATTSALALKIDKTVAGDKNSVMVRDGSGVYVKGLGNAVSVANDGTITVNQATNATNATNDGSGNNIANTYATKTEVNNTVGGLDLTEAQATGSGNVVTSVTQSDGQIAVVKNIKAIPEPTITDTTGTLVLTAKAAQDGGYEFRWEDLGR